MRLHACGAPVLALLGSSGRLPLPCKIVVITTSLRQDSKRRKRLADHQHAGNTLDFQATHLTMK